MGQGGHQTNGYQFSQFADRFCSELYRSFGNGYGSERSGEGFGQIPYSFWRNSTSLGKTLPVSEKTCTGFARSGKGFVESWHLAGQTGTFSPKSCTRLGRRCHFLGKCFPVFRKQVQLWGGAMRAIRDQRSRLQQTDSDLRLPASGKAIVGFG